MFAFTFSAPDIAMQNEVSIEARALGIKAETNNRRWCNVSSSLSKPAFLAEAMKLWETKIIILIYT